MCSDSPNFFVLDEPTNHLDMETIEALGDALNKFKVSLAVSVGNGDHHGRGGGGGGVMKNLQFLLQ